MKRGFAQKRFFFEAQSLIPEDYFSGFSKKIPKKTFKNILMDDKKINSKCNINFVFVKRPGDVCVKEVRIDKLIDEATRQGFGFMRTSEFFFLGEAGCSKSLLNRAFIVKSFYPEFDIKKTSFCEDIQVIAQATQNINQDTEFDCGFSGSAMRFLAFRLSRNAGEFLLKGEPQLMKRPFYDLERVLSQLGVQTKRVHGGFKIVSEGLEPWWSQFVFKR